MRTADRQRAQQRKTHQHAETDEQYQDRIRRDLEAATGLKVEIAVAASANRPGRQFIVKGYTPRGERDGRPSSDTAQIGCGIGSQAMKNPYRRKTAPGSKLRVHLLVSLTVDTEAYAEDAADIPGAVAREVQKILRMDIHYPGTNLSVTPTSLSDPGNPNEQQKAKASGATP